MDFLKTGLVGNIELNEYKKARKAIMERWDGLQMLEGLNAQNKENVAILYENEAKMLLREATDAQNSGSFETVVFPIIRRVFSKLLANDIVSVQALNLPIGKLFFMLPVTSQREWTKADGSAVSAEDPIEDGMMGSHKGLMGYERTDRRNGNRYNRFFLPDEAVQPMKFGAYHADGTVIGEDYETYAKAEVAAKAEEGAFVRQISPSVTKYHGKTLYDLFYNDFLYDNSKGKIHIRVVDGANVVPMVWKNGQLAEAKDSADFRLYGDGTVRNVIFAIKGFSSFNAGKLTGPDGNEMDTEEFLASLKFFSKTAVGDATDTEHACFAQYEAIPFRVVTQKYGKGIVEYESACDAEGTLYIDVDFAKPCVKQGASIDGYLGLSADQIWNAKASFQAAWSQYDSLEFETEIGEVSFKLSSVTVDVQERKLRAAWSPEMSQDVAAFHNIDAEAELTALLSEEIACEIDREILRDLRNIGWQVRWDVNGWRRMAAYSTNYTQKDWNQELITRVNQVSAQIHKGTLRGGANFIVVSSEISALFDNLEYFHVSDASAESDQYNLGIERIGNLSGRYQVYRDPYSPAWSMIIGHRGKSLLDTGYVYAPYIPMQLTPTVVNPETLTPVKGIMTRFAKKLVNNRFYGGVRVDGLMTWDPNELR